MKIFGARRVGLALVLVLAQVACGNNRERPDPFFGVDAGEPAIDVALVNPAQTIRSSSFASEGVSVRVSATDVPQGTSFIVAGRIGGNGGEFFRTTWPIWNDDATDVVSVRGWRSELDEAASVTIRAALQGRDGRTLAFDTLVVHLH